MLAPARVRATAPRGAIVFLGFGAAVQKKLLYGGKKRHVTGAMMLPAQHYMMPHTCDNESWAHLDPRGTGVTRLTQIPRLRRRFGVVHVVVDLKKSTGTGKSSCDTENIGAEFV